MNIDYWVFTSGEEGVHGLDWGIKFASPSFPDRYALDVEYRRTLQGFSLNPSLHRPNDTGLIVLPFRESAHILGFIFPGNDHGGRPNTSAAVALIPREVSRRMTVSGAVASLRGGNDIAAIARRNSHDRPGFLTLSDGVRGDSAGNLAWPEMGHGVIVVDGEARTLTMTDEPAGNDDAPKPRRNTGVMAAVLCVATVIAGGYFVLSGDDPAQEVPEPQAVIIESRQQTQTAESKPQAVIPESRQQTQATESKPQVVILESRQQTQTAESKPQAVILESRQQTHTAGTIPQVLTDNARVMEFIGGEALLSFEVSPTLPAMMRRLPSVLVDWEGISGDLGALLGGMRVSDIEGGFQVAAKGLPLEEWRVRKAEILRKGVINAGTVKPGKSREHGRVLGELEELRRSDLMQGWLSLRFATANEGVRLVVFADISGGRPSFRLEDDGGYSAAKSGIEDDISRRIRETESTTGYRIIFETGRNADDFSVGMSDFIAQFAEGEDANNE